jgi:uncharacterized protein (TIGR03083 family)
MTEEHAESYRRLRRRVTDLVSEIDPSALDRPAPATPEWRVRDVMAHMVGVADDVVNGRLDGLASDAWTAAQVERRRAVPVGQLFDDWEQWGPGFEQMLAAGPMEMTGQALFDSVTHEHDIRHAVARPGARDTDAMDHSWDWFLAVRTAAGAPAMRFITEQGEAISGTGDVRVTVQAPRFELMRAATGRRTMAEITNYAWIPAPNVHMLIGGPLFTIRTESLGE